MFCLNKESYYACMLNATAHKSVPHFIKLIFQKKLLSPLISLSHSHSLSITKSNNAPKAFFAAGALASPILSSITLSYSRNRSSLLISGV
mmetsp:Transcript_32591/g.62320  ORF Transcript_32591/g.62320 Transcript_32591/m.62320 type:complete len:90 (+) Transcript_32591:79-348(+)